MQIIQKIRDKGAAIVIGVIALSLIGFILMDANLGANRSSAGGGRSIGEINGQSIDGKDYQDKIKQIEDQYGGRVSGPQENYIRQNAWDQLVTEKVLSDEFDKLGLSFSPKELTSILFSDDAPQTLKQAFSDKATGQYDISKVQQWWQTAKKSKGDQRDALVKQIIEPLVLQSLANKYSNMIAASAYYPGWMKEKEITENKAFANISYVSVPYNVIGDSTIKVSDEDITAYLEKHKALYKQDGGRLISYVAFSADPNAEDTATALKSVESLKEAFAADTNAKAFVSKNMSVKPFADVYTLKSSLTMPQKDTIAQLANGALFGPYLDGQDFVIAKMLGSRQLPDSVKCRHILLSTQPDPQTGIAKLTDSAAKKRIDSIEAAIKGGADFAALVTQYSDDPGSKDKKGEYDFPYYSSNPQQSPGFAQLAKEFAEMIFFGTTGDKKVIKTDFGYHYIEVLNQRNFEPAYKIAYLAKEIAASEETVNSANAKASKLSGEARDLKALEAYVAKNGLQKIDEPRLIKENDFQLGALQDARELIRWAFGAKLGEVSEQQYRIGEQYVVGVVTKIQPEGLPDAKMARSLPAQISGSQATIEMAVRNLKKAEQIKAKLTATPTLETAAAAYGKQVAVAGADSSLTFNSTFVNGIGQEPKVVGASFNKTYQTKVSEPIVGINGVYVLKVNSQGTKPADTADDVAKQTQDRARVLAQQINSGWFESLKKLSVIKDERSKIN